MGATVAWDDLHVIHFGGGVGLFFLSVLCYRVDSFCVEPSAFVGEAADHQLLPPRRATHAAYIFVFTIITPLAEA